MTHESKIEKHRATLAAIGALLGTLAIGGVADALELISIVAGGAGLCGN